MSFEAFTRLFQRSVRLDIGALQLRNLRGEGLSVRFTVQRTNKPEPDEATISVYNLDPASRERIKAEYRKATAPGFARALPVRLNVGYEGRTLQLFQGDATDLVDPIPEGPDVRTDITASDGGRGYRTGFMHASLAGIDVNRLLDLATQSLGVKTSAQAKAAFSEALPGAKVSVFENGLVFSDTARSAMDRLAKDLGLRWWIRDGKLQMAKTVTTDFAVILNRNTGLLDYQPVKNGEVQFLALLNPQIFPGRQIQIQDPPGVLVEAYRVEDASYQGESWGGAWYVDGLAKAIRTL